MLFVVCNYELKDHKIVLKWKSLIIGCSYPPLTLLNVSHGSLISNSSLSSKYSLISLILFVSETFDCSAL